MKPVPFVSPNNPFLISIKMSSQLWSAHNMTTLKNWLTQLKGNDCFEFVIDDTVIPFPNHHTHYSPQNIRILLALFESEDAVTVKRTTLY